MKIHKHGLWLVRVGMTELVGSNPFPFSSEWDLFGNNNTGHDTANLLRAYDQPVVSEEEQHREDNAVRGALAELAARLSERGELPAGIHFMLCAHPAELGIPPEALATMESEAYEWAGYGTRAEGLVLFADAYRGYEPYEHGDLRFVIIVTEPSEGSDEGLRPLGFFNYFRITRHLDADFTEKAEEWKAGHVGMNPNTYLMSKLVADPSVPRRTAVRPGPALATVFAALSNCHPDGVFLETLAQPATKGWVMHHLPEFIANHELLLNKPLAAAGPGGDRAKMLAYIPPTATYKG